MSSMIAMLGMYLTGTVGIVLLVVQLRLLSLEGRGELPGVSKQKYQFAKAVEEVLKDLNRRWLLGDDNELWQKGNESCKEVLGQNTFVNFSYLACNPGLIECLGRNNFSFKVAVDKKNYQVAFSKAFKTQQGADRHYQIVTRSNGSSLHRPEYAVEVELVSGQFPGLSSRLLLGDICGMTYLPHGKYAYGPMPGKLNRNHKEWNWDNHGRFLYLDKFMVTNRDIIDWVEFGNGNPDLLAGTAGKVLAAPATHLLPEQMEKFCAFRGKQLMQAHVYDAATFVPFKNELKEKTIHRGAYPWSFKDSVGHLYQAQRDGSFTPTQETCQIVYSSECIGEFPLEHRGKLSNAWTGLYQVLGGYPEYMKNQIEPDKNVKMSSFYFPAVSGWHKLAMRSFWDGQGHELQNFAPETFPEVNGEIEVGFRCMKELERGQ